MTASPGAPGSPRSPATTPIRVMLVDDQDLFREGVRVIVDAQEGMEVVGTAGDGLEAVRQVDELSPDVVLMDIRMPEMDGVEATRQICAPDRVSRRRDQGRPPVRVVVLTTFNLDDRAATAIQHGASGFLLKDTTPAMLRDAIRTVHAGNAVLAPQDLTALLAGHFRAPMPTPPAYAGLTDKEREVFASVARGLSNTEIAGTIFASESTVKTHVGSILRKLELRDRVQIVVYAHAHALTPGPGAGPS
ncbi:response regulator transcription factor [Nocardioides sp.]|uniref:response regulator transcription factor n=1 Tax=Nocardioides sp. TaxID=35761 RepID=UPI00341AF0CE